jgi:hypothetical protein
VYRYKGLGVLSDPNDLAQFFVTLIPMLWIRWKPGSYVTNFFFTIVPALALATGMYFTNSRGGAIALVAVVLFGFKDKLGVILSAILAAGLLVGLMALNISGGRGMDNDDGGRVAAWSTGLEIFRSHPLIGVGIDRFPEFSETGHTAHNSYVLCLSEVGLLGYFFWMGLMVSNLSELGEVAHSKPRSDEGLGEMRSVVLPPHLAARAAGPGRTPALSSFRKESLALGAPGLGALAYQGAGIAGTATEQAWTPVSVRVGRTVTAEDPNSDASLQHVARVMRIAFVGLLTSAFFLSRSFSMVFYIVLGMSASVRLIYRSRHPEEKTNLPQLIKRNLIFIVGSVLFLYLFVRIRGIH